MLLTPGFDDFVEVDGESLSFEDKTEELENWCVRLDCVVRGML